MEIGGLHVAAAVLWMATLAPAAPSASVPVANRVAELWRQAGQWRQFSFGVAWRDATSWSRANEQAVLSRIAGLAPGGLDEARARLRLAEIRPEEPCEDYAQAREILRRLIAREPNTPGLVEAMAGVRPLVRNIFNGGWNNAGGGMRRDEPFVNEVAAYLRSKGAGAELLRKLSGEVEPGQEPAEPDSQPAMESDPNLWTLSDRETPAAKMPGILLARAMHRAKRQNVPGAWWDPNEYLGRILKEYPRSAEAPAALDFLALWHGRTNAREGADYWRRLLRDYPEHPLARVAPLDLAAQHAAAGEEKAMLGVLADAEKRWPGDVALAVLAAWRRAEFYYQKGRAAEALGEYQAAQRAWSVFTAELEAGPRFQAFTQGSQTLDMVRREMVESRLEELTSREKDAFRQAADGLIEQLRLARQNYAEGKARGDRGLAAAVAAALAKYKQDVAAAYRRCEQGRDGSAALSPAARELAAFLRDTQAAPADANANAPWRLMDRTCYVLDYDWPRTVTVYDDPWPGANLAPISGADLNRVLKALDPKADAGAWGEAWPSIAEDAFLRDVVARILPNARPSNPYAVPARPEYTLLNMDRTRMAVEQHGSRGSITVRYYTKVDGRWTFDGKDAPK